MAGPTAQAVVPLFSIPPRINIIPHAAGFDSQKLRFLPLTNGKFKFHFKHSGMVWDIPNGSRADNVQMQQHPSNGDNRLQFQLERTYWLEWGGSRFSFAAPALSSSLSNIS